MAKGACQCDEGCRPGWCTGLAYEVVIRRGSNTEINVCSNCTLPGDKYVASIDQAGCRYVPDWRQ